MAALPTPLPVTEAPLHVRDLGPTDEPLVDALHASLSPRSQYQRYHGAKPRLTPRERRYLAATDARDHIALVGFDDFELADVLGITVMRSDPGLMGLRAAELAFARLDGDDRPPRRVVVPTELVPRGSGELPPP